MILIYFLSDTYDLHLKKGLMNTKQILSFLLILFISSRIEAQDATVSEKIAEEVNNTVWKPFKKAYETRDAEAFNTLHTDDVLRVSKWGIKVGDEYKNGVINGYKRYAESQITTTIDFWLEHRIYKGDVGYEVGYYRIVQNELGKKERTSYARFHVVLRKESGKWKIAQDWDTSNLNGVEVTAEDFEKGTMLDL